MKFYAIFLLLIGVTLHLGVAAPLEEDTGEAPVEGDANESPAEGEQVGDATTLAPSEEDSNDDLLELPNEHNETIKGYVFEAVDPDEEETEGSGDENHPPQILVLIEDDSNYEEESKKDDIFPEEILFLLENNSTLLGDEPFGPYSDPKLIQEAQDNPKVLKVDTVQSLFHLLPSLNSTEKSENETSAIDESQTETPAENDEEANGDETQAESVDSTDSEDGSEAQDNLINNEAEEKETKSSDTDENAELDKGDSIPYHISD